MAKSIGTDRLKLNPQLGRMPTLQFCRPAELHIDPAYQRDIDNGGSQALIRRIAQHWNWDLCQPLTVSRRVGEALRQAQGERDSGERLFVIDGQHRLAAARLRGDIDQLPCVIVAYADAAEEAASFVHLNQSRKALNALDLFKAALASGDSETTAIVAAMHEAGLSVAPHGNFISWKPGMVANVHGIRAAWRNAGPGITAAAMGVMARAWGAEPLRYAGTVWPGIVAICEDLADERRLTPDVLAEVQRLVGARSQQDWRDAVAAMRVEKPGLRFDAASAMAFRRAWRQSAGVPGVGLGQARPEPVKVAPRDLAAVAATGSRWCEQCERRQFSRDVAACRSPFCKLRGAV